MTQSTREFIQGLPTWDIVANGRLIARFQNVTDARVYMRAEAALAGEHFNMVAMLGDSDVCLTHKNTLSEFHAVERQQRPF